MTTYCSNCGIALAPGSRFCSACGATVAGTPMGFSPAYPPHPRLLRPRIGRQFAGVCIGLARTYNWDVSVVRIVAVVAGIFLFPVTEIVYLACWIGIPEEVPGDLPPQV